MCDIWNEVSYIIILSWFFILGTACHRDSSKRDCCYTATYSGSQCQATSQDLKVVFSHKECILNNVLCLVTQPYPTLQLTRLLCSLSMGFLREEYWSGLICPPPGDLSNPGIEPRSPALQADSLLSEPPGKPMLNHMHL